MTSLENLLCYYNTLEFGGTTHTVLRHCLTHLADLPNMTINQLADCCYTSPSTISRLVKALGYRSYAAFQQAMDGCLSHYHFHHRLVPPSPIGSGNLNRDMEAFLDNIQRIVDEARKLVTGSELETISKLMHESGHVVIFPYGTLFCELYLQSDLFVTGIPCDVINGDSAQLKVANEFSENSLALFLSPECIEGYVTTEAAIRAIKKRKGKVCIVSIGSSAPFSHLSDYSVSFHGSRHVVDSFLLEIFVGLLTIKHRQMYLDKNNFQQLEGP